MLEPANRPRAGPVTGPVLPPSVLRTKFFPATGTRYFAKTMQNSGPPFDLSKVPEAMKFVPLKLPRKNGNGWEKIRQVTSEKREWIGINP